MRYLVDLHTHTTASGHAYSTIIETAQYAARRGLQLFATTDHGPAIQGGPHAIHFRNLHIVPYVVEDVALLHGVELNIMQDGSVDLPDETLAKLDIVLAGFHGHYHPRCMEDDTNTLIKVMASGKVDIIAHPDNRTYQLDYQRLCEASLEYKVALEINASSVVVRPGSEDNLRTMLAVARKVGNPLSLGSDAHFAYKVGDFRSVMPFIEEAEIPAAQIINVSPCAVLDFLESRGHKRIDELRERFEFA